MDISQILPLLISGADGNNDQAKMLSALMGGNGKPEDILSAMANNSGIAGDTQNKAQGANFDMMTMMNLLNSNKKQTSNKFEGLSVISNFAPPDILGTMYKILSSN